MVPSERRYSQHARRSLIRARLLAQEFKHGVVDTDHLLLGIWRTEGSIGALVLNDFDIHRESAEAIIREMHPPQEEPPTPIPYSKNLQFVLLYAADESYWLGHHYIGTEHILLGLVRSGTGQLSNALYQLNISGTQVRQRIRLLLNEHVYESTLEAVRRSARLSELSRRVLNAAAKLAEENNHPAAGLEHLLLVLAREQRSMATRLLLETGIEQGQLTQDIRKLRADPVMAATALDEILARAVDLTEKLGMHYIGTDHILLAMTLDDEAIALMTHYGVDVPNLQARLRMIFNK